MADNEPVSFKKFGLSWLPVAGAPWMKRLNIILTVAAALFAGVTIWRAYFRKDVQQTQNQAVTQTINAQPGSTVNVEAPKQTQESPKKDKKYEPFVFVVGGAHGGQNSETGWFAGAGAGIKF